MICIWPSWWHCYPISIKIQIDLTFLVFAYSYVILFGDSAWSFFQCFDTVDGVTDMQCGHLKNSCLMPVVIPTQTGTQQVQALTDISRSVLCCHSNETRALIANPRNSAQLEDTPYHSSKLHRGLCSSVGMQRGTDRQTNKQTAMTNIHFTSATLHAKSNKPSCICNRNKLLKN